MLPLLNRFFQTSSPCVVIFVMSIDAEWRRVIFRLPPGPLEDGVMLPSFSISFLLFVIYGSPFRPYLLESLLSPLLDVFLSFLVWFLAQLSILHAVSIWVPISAWLSWGIFGAVLRSG